MGPHVPLVGLHHEDWTQAAGHTEGYVLIGGDWQMKLPTQQYSKLSNA